MSPHNPFTNATSVTRIRDLPRRASGIVVAHETDQATAERLSALGLCVGASFTVMQAGDRPTIRVGESRIGLGPELSCAVHAVSTVRPTRRTVAGT